MTQAISRNVDISSNDSSDRLRELYDHDFLQWVEVTAEKLRARDFENIDLENLIEEIETLGRTERQKLRSRLNTLLEHLLKRVYVNMPQEFNGWERTIREQRKQLIWLLKDYPSLKPLWSDVFEDAYDSAIKDVLEEYQPQGFDFPEQWQFSREIEAILNTKFWELSK